MMVRTSASRSIQRSLSTKQSLTQVQHVRRHISIAKANVECLCKVLDNSGDHTDPDAAALASASWQRDLRPSQEAYRTTTTATTSRTGRGSLARQSL